MILSTEANYKVTRNGNYVGTYYGAIKLFAVLAHIDKLGYDSMEDFRDEYPDDEFECEKA